MAVGDAPVSWKEKAWEIAKDQASDSQNCIK
jgi:hypothetical protein